MNATIIASRQFTALDQVAFATLSGDYNPMHMDPVAARRTQAGAPVVHGVHMLLWLLDSLAQNLPDLPPIATLRVRFDKLVYVGDTIQAVLRQNDAAAIKLEITANDTVVLRVQAGLGAPRAASADVAEGASEQSMLQSPAPGAPALDLSLEQMADRHGRIAFAGSNADFAVAFPAAARAWGERRLAALTGSTFLVGMVCPGLHSIFGGLALTFCDDSGTADDIAFKVTRTDARFRMVRMEISGGGLFGTVESFARHPPAMQASLPALARLVTAGEFADSTALVIGGSRGLGELTAKILAAGGARVVITYATGQEDAARLQAEIRAFGGQCEVLRYDARASAEAQLHDLAELPDTLYYYATPTIARRKSAVFVPERYAEFSSFYVEGFYRICEALRRLRPAGISAFYPSTIFVEDRPAEMTEYAMSKAAGEVLCADMVAHQQPISIVLNRLPRLPTDQTATLTGGETDDPIAVMLPIIREVQARRFS